MAIETEGIANGYLRRLLADGARPFRYRGRVRSLLGHLDEYRGVKMASANPLALAGSSVPHRHVGSSRDPQGAPDAGKPQPVSYTGDPADSSHSVVRASGSGRPDAPEAPQVAADAGHQRQHPVTVQNVAIPGSAVSHPTPHAGLPVARPVSVPPPDIGEQVTPALNRRDVTIPDVRDPRSISVAHSGIRSLEIDTVREPESDRTHARQEEPRRVATAEPSLPGVTNNPADRAAGGFRRPYGAVAGATSRPIAPVSVEPLAISGEAKTRFTPQERPPAAAAPESADRHWTPEALRRDLIPVVRTVPSARAPHQRPRGESTPRRSEATEHVWTDTAHREAVAPPLPQPSEIVVTQVAGPGTTPLAFWERRHLTHLRTRVRR
jgi:hypothetical protein